MNCDNLNELNLLLNVKNELNERFLASSLVTERVWTSFARCVLLRHIVFFI